MLGALRPLAATGKQVLWDAVVVGFVDDVPEAGLLRPPLTTARRAVHPLLDLIRPQGVSIASVPAPLPALVPTEPVVRRSTSPA
jgi:DNA-binding LacI/PurR family transcriptional regulator